MKTKRSTLISLLSTLLVIITVLTSVLVFTATADTEPEDASDDRYVYAENQSDLIDEIQDLVFDWNAPTTWFDDTSSADDGFLIIDLNEVGDYDIVEIGIGKSSANYLYFAFLEEKPTAAGDEVVLTEGTKVTKYSKSGYKEKFAGLVYYADIPEGANYLAIRARSWGTKICPYSLAFERTDSNLLNSSLDSYAYPMSKVVPSMAVIMTSGKYEVVNYGDFSTALIPIEGTTFDAVTFKSNANYDTTVYAFLTEAPVPTKSVSFAGGMTATAKAADGETVKIPEDAKYLAILYKEYNYDTSKVDVYLPESIVFRSTDVLSWGKIPAVKETVTVQYESLTQSEGYIYGWNSEPHEFVASGDSGHRVGFVDISDRDYAKVSFVVGDNSKGYLGYSFLTEIPEIGENASYASGYSGFVEHEGMKGRTISVSVPSNAKAVMIWMQDNGDSTDFSPASIALTYEVEIEIPYGLELKLGAEARLAAISGLHFTSRIPTEELAGLGDYTIGVLIFPTDYLGKGQLTVESEGALNIVMTRGVVGGDYTYFSAAMTNIIAQNYARSFTAVSYIEIDGKYYYTEATTSSIYEAAVATYKANAEDANADAVRAYIDAVVVIENGAQTLPYSGYEHALLATVSGNTLTISAKDGSSLSANDLKTVILDGVIFTGGWKVSGKNLTATLPTSLDATATDEDQLNWALDDDTNLSFSHPEPEWDKWDNSADIMTATNSLLYLTYELRNCYNNSTYYDACLTRILEQLRYLIDEDNYATPFFDLDANWPYCNLTAAIALCKDTPAIWNSLTKDERARYDLIMECFAYICALGTDDDNDYRTGPLLGGNYAKGWNPNYRLANVTPMIFVADYFGGADAVDVLLLSFDYDSVIARMKAYGFDRSYNAWTTATPAGKPTIREIMMNGGKAYLPDDWLVPSGGSGKGVRTTYTYNGYRLDQPGKILASLFEYNYSGGAVISEKKYSSLEAYIVGGLTSPYQGQLGMMLEFGKSDRSSAEYCMHDFVMVVAILMVTEELDIYDPLDAENLDLFRLVWVGNQDFMYKYEMGYMSYANDKSQGIVKESTAKGYMLMKAWWNDRYGDPTYTISFPYGS